MMLNNQRNKLFDKKKGDAVASPFCCFHSGKIIAYLIHVRSECAFRTDQEYRE